MNHLAGLQVYDLPPAAFLGRLPEALTLYTVAMGYSPDVISYRTQPWREDTKRSGWQAVGAFEPPSAEGAGGQLLGFAYAYTGSADLPWHQHVARAVKAAGSSGQLAAHMLTNYVELTEIHVQPGLQGHGLGETMLRQLLHGRPEPYVLLSTPEVEFEANRAWRLYRRLGFVDVIRNMKFPGDSRPFAILGRALPISPPGQKADTSA